MTREITVGNSTTPIVTPLKFDQAEYTRDALAKGARLFSVLAFRASLAVLWRLALAAACCLCVPAPSLCDVLPLWAPAVLCTLDRDDCFCVQCELSSPPLCVICDAAIYFRLFDWIVAKINKSLQLKDVSSHLYCLLFAATWCCCPWRCARIHSFAHHLTTSCADLRALLLPD